MSGSSARWSRFFAPCSALLALALLAGAGCTPTGRGVEPTKPSALVEIEASLERRAKALNRGDVAGYLRDVGPGAIAAEQAIAQASLSVPIIARRLVLDEDSVTEAGGKIRNASVDLTYRYEGLPSDNTFRVSMVNDFDRIGGQWTVSSSRVADEGSLPAWATGATTFRRSEHFLGLFRVGLQDADRVLQIAERAREQLARKITFPLESSQLLLMARGRAEYEQMSAHPSPVSAIAQAETAFEVTPEAIKVRSRQIVLDLEKLFIEGSAQETFVHELGHLALANVTRPFTPAWVSESAAMYLADTRPVPTWRSGVRRGVFEGISFSTLNRASALGQHDPTGETASFEYAYSAAAAWYITETFGPEKLFDFYRAYTEVSPADFYDRLPTDNKQAAQDEAVAALAVETTAQALNKTFGFNEQELDTRVRQWIRTEIKKR